MTQQALMKLFRRADWREGLVNNYRSGLNMARLISTLFGTPPSTLDVWRGKAGEWRLQARLRFTSKRQIMHGYTQSMDAAIANCRLPHPMRRPLAASSPPISSGT